MAKLISQTLHNACYRTLDKLASITDTTLELTAGRLTIDHNVAFLKMSGTGTAPLPQPPAQSKALKGVELTLKFGALFFGLVYALGFLVIAIHHAQFSIPEFDPLKPKIFAAGLVFVLFVGLPILAALRLFGFFGLQKSTGFAIPVNTENAGAFKMILVFTFWYGAYTISFITDGVFVGGFEEVAKWGFTYFLVCISISAVLLVFMRKHFNRHPLLFVLATFLLAAADAFATFRFMDRKLFWMCIWTYVVGLWGLYHIHLLKEPEQRRRFEWEQLIPIVATLIFVYGAFLYGYITPYFGGGKPTAGTLYFASKVPFTNSDSAEAFFLEETSSGYYVLLSGDEKHAYFLRHDLISAIHFGIPEKRKTESCGL